MKAELRSTLFKYSKFFEVYQDDTHKTTLISTHRKLVDAKKEVRYLMAKFPGTTATIKGIQQDIYEFYWKSL